MAKTWKKWVSTSMAAVLVLTLILNTTESATAVEYGAELNPNEKTYTQTFSDVRETHWAFKYIEEMVERGAIGGYPDGKFYPSKIVTREEFAKIMVVAASLTATPAAASSYADVPLTRWSSPFVETAKPYMTAYQSGGQLYFKPEDGALREDMAVAVVMLKGYDTRLADLSMINTMFKDVDAISMGARSYVALAVENGIISGYDDGTFRGQATITRAEAAAILWRAFQYGNDNKVMPGEEITTTQPANTSKPGTTTTLPDTTLPKVEEVKPFVADTLTKANISDTTMFVAVDDDDNLIYYDTEKNAILSLDVDNGEVETLLDVSVATYTDMDGVVYERMTVEQVFWDDVDIRLLVVGTFQSAKTGDGWETGSGNQSYSAIFTLKNGKLEKTFEKPNKVGNKTIGGDYGMLYGSYYYVKLSVALGDGTYVCSIDYKERYATNPSYWDEGVFDLSDVQVRTFEGDDRGETLFGKRNTYSNNFHSYKMGADKRNLYYMDINSGQLSRFDYGTGGWVTVRENIYGNALDYKNGYFYIWGRDDIRLVRPSDGAHQIKLNPSEDVEILDMRALPTNPDNLFVTSDEQYLFYDSTAKAIRVIRANPEAN